MISARSWIQLALVLFAPITVEGIADHQVTRTSFKLVEGGLATTKPIPFDEGWISTPPGSDRSEVCSTDGDDDRGVPSHLHAPDYVQVFEFQNHLDGTEGEEEASTPSSSSSIRNKTKLELLKEAGKTAREIVDSCFASNNAEAVLFRNLDSVIESTQDFKVFWNECLGDDGWTPTEYIPFFKPRTKDKGVDLVTPFPPEIALPCHNEMIYNPRNPSKIAFYCHMDAPEGGETILARNSDLTKVISQDIQQLVKNHGGILYRREYFNRDDEDSVKNALPYEISWQEKTGAEDKDGAMEFFRRIGFDRIHFTDEDDRLIVENVHSGFNEDGNWANILDFGIFLLADKTPVPKEMFDQIRRDKWSAVKVLKLAPGDWIVLNNRAVQHGRLPFKNNPGQQRTILTVYTE